MPDAVGKRTFVPGKSYEIQLLIKDQDFSNDLIRCQLMASVNTIYDIVKLELFVDVRDIIIGITSEDPLKLVITPIGDIFGDRQEKIEMELMYVESSYEVPIKPMLYRPHQVDRTSFPIMCLTRKPYKTMTTLMNKIYLGKTIRYAIEDMVNSTETNATLTMDNDGINSETIDQILIPPVTLSKAITYLNETFGIYNGILNFDCNYENNVDIRNLTARMNKSNTFTIYQLASDDPNNLDILSETSEKPNVYFTYDQINTNYGGNLKATTLAKSLKHIVKPSDTLYYEIEHDLDTLVESYGLSFSSQGNKKIQLDSIVDDRIRYYIEHTGYERSESFAIANISKFLANVTTLDINIERNLNILPLLKTGETVKFNSKISEYDKMTGKYILGSSLIDFNRVRDWETTVRIHLIRTNKDR